MKKIWIKKFASHQKAEEADHEYYSKLSPEERLGIIQFLRETYFKMKGIFRHEGRGRLRRVIKIIQQA
jgi:hypothetical protein